MISNFLPKNVESKLSLTICLPVIDDKISSYKHAIDGLWRVYKEEGVARLWSGASTATSRAVFMTIGQLSFYDQVKKMLLQTPYFDDNIATHFVSSLTAVSKFFQCI